MNKNCEKGLSMRMRQACLQSLKTLLIFSLFLQMSACGALLYPERQGQKKGKIDVGIAVLDGVGLLFFIVPGVVAFAVDFATGAIYLPPGQPKNKRLADKGVPVVQVDLKDLNIVNIEAIVAGHTGHRISFSTSNIEISKLKNESELVHQFDIWALNNAIYHHASS